ncbi:hypothetical protein APHAL10511_007916 [Amanita phalloides]|nr:hypothetical protein APHAL10511_007916 [Amanita phalloides]
MRALDLFVTIALSLSASAHDDSRLQRKDIVPEDAVNGLGISNRDLAVVSTSNTSDADSLNMNSKRALDDPHPVVSVKEDIIPLTMLNGLFAITITIDADSISRVVLDTGANTTWVQRTNRRHALNDSPFRSMGLVELRGGRANGVVTVDKVPAKEMGFRTVRDKIPGGYAGGLALDRSRISWPNYIRHHGKTYPVFSIYSPNQYHAEFHLGPVPSRGSLQKMQWYTLNPNKRQWTLDNAHIKVNGLSLGTISTIMHTGVQYIYGSEKQVREVYQKLGSCRQLDGLWMIRCNRRQTAATFSWDKTNFPIRDFLVGGDKSVLNEMDYCQGVIRPHHSIPDNTFVLGTGFFYGKNIAFGKQNTLGIMLTDYTVGNKKYSQKLKTKPQ